MKKIAVYLLVILTILFLTGCSSKSNKPEVNTSLVFLKTGDIIEYGMTKSELIDILGEPLGGDDGVTVLDEIVFESGIEIYFRADVAVSFKFENDQFSTSKDVKVGDHIEKIKEKYGDTPFKKHIFISYYFDSNGNPITSKENLPKDISSNTNYYGLIFIIHDDVVANVMMSDTKFEYKLC